MSLTRRSHRTRNAPIAYTPTRLGTEVATLNTRRRSQEQRNSNIDNSYNDTNAQNETSVPYTLNIDKAMSGKIEAANRESQIRVEMKHDNLVLELTAACYEEFKSVVKGCLVSKHIKYDITTKTDKNNLLVEEQISVKNKVVILLSQNKSFDKLNSLIRQTCSKYLEQSNSNYGTPTAPIKHTKSNQECNKDANPAKVKTTIAITTPYPVLGHCSTTGQQTSVNNNTTENKVQSESTRNNNTTVNMVQSESVRTKHKPTNESTINSPSILSDVTTDPELKQDADSYAICPICNVFCKANSVECSICTYWFHYVCLNNPSLQRQCSCTVSENNPMMQIYEQRIRQLELENVRNACRMDSIENLVKIENLTTQLNISKNNAQTQGTSSQNSLNSATLPTFQTRNNGIPIVVNHPNARNVGNDNSPQNFNQASTNSGHPSNIINENVQPAKLNTTHATSNDSLPTDNSKQPLTGNSDSMQSEQQATFCPTNQSFLVNAPTLTKPPWMNYSHCQIKPMQTQQQHVAPVIYRHPQTVHQNQMMIANPHFPQKIMRQIPTNFVNLSWYPTTSRVSAPVNRI
ncbi:unnamed protein product [Mytilus edulis]|uniref:Zinc finger PHD-type domain-containing protein n=1 Tax=Mytilus edulis TaxID=6550 RepID=A0A8S3UX54_MYTED|nr:unnamed protein product [Mytilus edulis]